MMSSVGWKERLTSIKKAATFPTLVFVYFVVPVFAIFYPWVYTVFDNVMCQPYGTLDVFKLACHCIPSYNGSYCNQCIAEVNGRGVCSGRHVICNDKWMGANCSTCHTRKQNTNFCIGDCKEPWYNDPRTGRCTYCLNSTTCSGHGTCTGDGTCKCFDGYAGEAFIDLEGMSTCDKACPVGGNNSLPCSGHGSCVAGGLCKCTGVWCGPACETRTCQDDSCTKPCNGNGYPVQVYDAVLNTNADAQACKCECKVDRNGNPLALGPDTSGFLNFCKYPCPIGAGGAVCGTSRPPKIHDNACMCQCTDNDKVLRREPCESDCFYGGQETIDGQCICHGNAVGKCDVCSTGYFFPELHCSQFCLDGVTCQSGGQCGPSSADRFTVTCLGCSAHRDGTIVDFTQSTSVTNTITFNKTSTASVSFQQVYLVGDEQRKLVLTPQPAVGTTAKGPKLHFQKENGIYSPVLTLGTTSNATLYIPPNHLTMNFGVNKVQTLAHRMPYTSTTGMYVTVLPGIYTQDNVLVNATTPQNFTSFNSSAAQVCDELGSECAGYSNHNGGELYARVCALQDATEGCSTEQRPNVVVLVSYVKLQPIISYTGLVVDSLRRGCARCEPDYYPAPRFSTDNQACTNHCTETLCNNMGTCSLEGLCVCNYANMDKDCGACLPGYYPYPANTKNLSAIIPCSVQCDADAVPGPSTVGNACSGHGFCDPLNGTCICQDSIRSKPNGWSGVPTGSACNIACAVGSSTDSTSVCSNNGECVNNICECFDGFFGAHCNITCNREEQYFYVNESATLSPACLPFAAGCDVNVPCGTDESSLCTRMTCNGGACVSRYQYEHVSESGNFKTLYHEPCSISDRLGARPLLNCTALTADEYDMLANSNKTNFDAKTYIEQTMGIYCDVSKLPSNSFRSNFGLCARTLCNCNGQRKNMNQGATAQIVAQNRPGASGQSAKGIVQLPSAQPLAGAGCQYVGCFEAEFGDDGTAYQSPCGKLPPPATTDNSVLDIMYNEDSEPAARAALDTFLQSIAKFCSHGECKSVETDSSQIIGTKDNPAPPSARAAFGACSCKNAPQTTEQCKGEGIYSSTWVQQCCTGYYDAETTTPVPPGFPVRQVTSKYYGENCEEQCSCAGGDYSRGTCAQGIDGGEPIMGVSCTCRQGLRTDDDTVPGPFNYSNTLFCGATCRYQCRGIIDVASTTPNVVSHTLANSCPNAKDDTPPRESGCYTNVVPCWGHGACAGQGQACRLGKTVFNLADCACWGSDVNVADIDNGGILTNQILLPARVVLYGGNDCRRMCPGVMDRYNTEPSVLQYFRNNRARLEQNPLNADARDVVEGFVELYNKNVCNGHGYCTQSSAVVNGTLQCTCTGDWGGLMCTERCSLPASYWTQNSTVTRPAQDVGADVTVETALSDYYGLNLCGPHACCGCSGSFDKQCDQDINNFKDGQYTAMYRYGPASPNIEGYLTSLPIVQEESRTQSEIDAFIRQWSLAFVGPFSTCKKKYFSSSAVERSKGLHDELLGVPKLVAWQLVRTCDAEYKANTWQAGVPWCCTASDTLQSGEFYAWQDEAFAPNGHGGCPTGACRNFATGQSCRECVDKYEYTNVGALDSGTCAPADKAQTEGYCTVCQAQGLDRRIAPYKQPNPAFWPNKCHTCLTSLHTLSGLRAVGFGDLQPVCNDASGHADLNTQQYKEHRNVCIGDPQTFSDRLVTLSTASVLADLPASGSFMLLNSTGTATVHNSLQLGLCKCSALRNGPTCAMPATNDACVHGQVQELSHSPHAEEGTVYHYCYCDHGYYGMYCERSWGTEVASLLGLGHYEPNNDNTLTAVYCNGQGKRASNGQCECFTAELDPKASCYEYKARGPFGVRTQYQRTLLSLVEISTVWNSSRAALEAQLAAEHSLPDTGGAAL